MTQYARPTGTPTTVGWTGAAADVADSGGVNDATYIESPLSPTSASSWDCALSGVTDPNTDNGLVLRFRPVLNLPGGDTQDVTVRVYRAIDDATVLSHTARVTHPIGEVAVTLTPSQAAAIQQFASGMLRVRVSAVTPAPGVSLLSPSDLTLVGIFTLPSGSGATDILAYANDIGLAVRYVGGVRRILTNGNGNYGSPLLQWVEPATYGTSAPYAAATLEYNYGDVTINAGVTRRVSGGLPGGTAEAAFNAHTDLWWDETDQRLYWGYAYYYSGEPRNYSMGFSTLNDTTHTGTGIACQELYDGALGARGSKNAKGQFMAIPTAFANAYLGGKRIGVGSGGASSVISVGGVSMGPALCAVSPPTETHKAQLPYVPMLGYKQTGHVGYARPYRCQRQASYELEVIDTPEGWYAQGDVGYFTNADAWSGMGMAWVDTTTKHGLICSPQLCYGRVWYGDAWETPGGSNLNGQTSGHWLYVYDPADLALVAQGLLGEDEVVPAATWKMNLPLANVFDGMGFGSRIASLAWDATASQLLVRVNNYPQNHAVLVYQVS